MPFEALSIRHLISALFFDRSCCDSSRSMKSLNYGIQALCFQPLMPGKLSEYMKLEKHTQNSCLKFTAVNVECSVWEKECRKHWVQRLAADGLPLPDFSLGIVCRLLCRDSFAWQDKGPLLETLLSISPGFAFQGAFLAAVVKFSLHCSLGTKRNLVFERNVSAWSGGVS